MEKNLFIKKKGKGEKRLRQPFIGGKKRGRNSRFLPGFEEGPLMEKKKNNPQPHPPDIKRKGKREGLEPSSKRLPLRKKEGH